MEKQDSGNSFSLTDADYAKAGDYDGFASLFSHFEDETGNEVRNCYAHYRNTVLNHNNKKNVYYVTDCEGYYLCESLRYLVTKSGNKTSCHSDNSNFWITCENGQWFIVKPKLDAEAFEAINRQIYGDPGTDAAKAGRNAATFGNFMFTNPEMVFEGDFNAFLISMWQNADGSVDAQIVLTNGTNVIKHVTELTLKVDDNALGQIVNKTFNTSINVPPMRSIVYTVHLSRGDIRRTGVWTTMHSDMHISY